MDKILSGAMTTDQRRTENDGIEGILRIPQSSSMIGAIPSDYLESYPGNLLRKGGS